MMNVNKRKGKAVGGAAVSTPNGCYAIPLEELTCSGKFLWGLDTLESDGEVDTAEADGGPHGLEAFGGEAIETTVLDLGDEAMAAELGDQA